MAIPKTMFFVDGENLVMRYQAMLQEGQQPADEVVHEPDCFVWHPRVTKWSMFDMIRVSYYTTVVGDEQRLVEVRKKIAEQVYDYDYDPDAPTAMAQIIPRVFKKDRRSRKTRQVDINIIIDVMRHAYARDIDQICLLSGDGDYLPLVEEVMRHGKHMCIAAFSSGLNEQLTYSVDEFVDLDEFFFKPHS